MPNEIEESIRDKNTRIRELESEVAHYKQMSDHLKAIIRSMLARTIEWAETAEKIK